MRTQFSELEIGQRFHYNIDADGHEPYLYKISDTEAYVEHGSGAGFRENIKPDADVWIWSEPVTLHSHPTEVERAAITMLMGPRGDSPMADHPGLYQFIRAIASDPNEMRDLDRYIWESSVGDYEDGGNEIPLRTICYEAGYICWKQEWDHDNSAFGAILDHQPRGRHPVTAEERRFAGIDDAAARLADSIINYRVAGRPDGDQTHTIHGMGSPLLNITTSLAAAVAEYHQQMLNEAAREKFALHRLLNEATPDDLITQTEAACLLGVTPQAISNMIRVRKLRAYADPDAVPHKPGNRKVSRADVERLRSRKK